MEQLNIVLTFQGLYLRGQGRLAQSRRPRPGTETAVAGDSEKGP